MRVSSQLFAIVSYAIATLAAPQVEALGGCVDKRDGAKAHSARCVIWDRRQNTKDKAEIEPAVIWDKRQDTKDEVTPEPAVIWD